jgi:hypothetical protein
MITEVDELRRSAENRFCHIGEAAVEYARSRRTTLRSVVVRGHAADAIVRFSESDQLGLVSSVITDPHELRGFCLGARATASVSIVRARS